MRASIPDSFNSWIAVPKHNYSFNKALFTRNSTELKGVAVLRKVVEDAISQSCKVLTVGQRCADWFVLRQFQITETNFGLILLRSTVVRSILGLG